MALFNKNEPDTQENTSKPVKPAKKTTSGDAISSIISQDMKITGEMSFKGKARVDGTVEGNVKGEHLVLSESGRVIGDLDLVTLICHGSIEGNVKAQQVTAHSSSSLAGNLNAMSLTVESGAKLNGEVSSSQPQSATQQRTQPVSTPPKATTLTKETPKS